MFVSLTHAGVQGPGWSPRELDLGACVLWVSCAESVHVWRFMVTAPLSSRQDFLPADIQTQFAVSRELIRSIYNSFYKLRDRAERMAARAIDNAADLLIFGKELRQVARRLAGPGEGGALGFGAGLMHFL